MSGGEEKDRIEEEDKNKGDAVKLLQEIEKNWKSQEMKTGPLNRLCGPSVQKDLAINIKTIAKNETKPGCPSDLSHSGKRERWTAMVDWMREEAGAKKTHLSRVKNTCTSKDEC